MRKILINIGTRSRKAFAQPINTKKKNKVLNDYLKLIKKNQSLILKENRKDIEYAIKIKLKDNLINRLILNQKKILNIINSIKKIIKLKDPIDNVIEKWKRPNGLVFSKISKIDGVNMYLPTTPISLGASSILGFSTILSNSQSFLSFL